MNERRISMEVSYKKLWKILIDKDMKYKDGQIYVVNKGMVSSSANDESRQNVLNVAVEIL
jgi:hypothetical protein